MTEPEQDDQALAFHILVDTFSFRAEFYIKEMADFKW